MYLKLIESGFFFALLHFALELAGPLPYQFNFGCLVLDCNTTLES